MSALPRLDPVLRVMRGDDLEAIMEIEVAAYPYPWTEGIFRDCMRVGYSCWVYEASGKMLGYAVMSLAVGECHLLNLCIRPKSQGHGLGRRLLREVLDIAASRGADTAFLEVRPSNTPALELYRSEGFNEIGLRRRYYPAADGREDALVFAKTLMIGEFDRD